MMITMTGKERIEAVFNKQIPDRVPTFEWDFYRGVIKAISGSDDIDDFIVNYDLDGIAIWQDRRITPIDDRFFKDEFGVVRAYSDEYPSAVSHPIDDPEDLSSYVMPDPDDDAIYATLQRSIDKIGHEKAVIGRVRDVFSFPRDVLGFENMLADFYEEPDLISDLMEMSMEYSLRVAANMKAMGVEVIGCLDDIADARGLFMGPKIYREQILPHFKKFISGCHSIGLKVIKHSDGNLNEVISDLIDAGIDGLDPIDPMGNMDMSGIKAMYGDKIVLKGNIDCVGTLITGSLADVENDVKRCIKSGAKGGAFIISSSNSIHKGINPQNYLHMLHCIHDFGKY
jgi:uroporphyrinogen decarboxylase